MKLLTLIIVLGFATLLAAIPVEIIKNVQKKFKLSDFSDIDDVISDKLKKKFGDFVKNGLGGSEQKLRSIRKKIKLIKKLEGIQHTAKMAETTSISVPGSKGASVAVPEKKKLTATVSAEKRDPDLDEIVFEGDLLLTESQLDEIIESVADNVGVSKEVLSELGVKTSRTKRQAVRYTGTVAPINRLWPITSAINYDFNTNIDDKTKDIIYEAFKNIQNQTCITFDEDANMIPRMQFVDVTDTCLSIVGFSGEDAYDNGCLGCDGSGKHPINIGSNCRDSFGTISHEILHALGINHHMVRYDRNYYVIIDEDEYPIKTTSNSYNYGTPYEYGSVLHYGNNMETVDPLYQNTIGFRNGPTFGDIGLLNARYKCKCINPTVTCVNGGYPNPADCSRCNCPGGFGGITCLNRDTGTENLGAVYAASRTTSCHTLDTSLGDDEEEEQVYMKKVWYHFKAPAGKFVQLIIWKATDFKKKKIQGCYWNGVEMKLHKDEWNRTGYLICGNDATFVSTSPDDVKSFTSDSERAMLQLFSRLRKLDVIVKYRVVDSDTEGDIPESCKPPPPCEDTNTVDCPGWQADGFCEDENQIEYMKEQCSKTCGFC